jgi:glutathione S-transferase
MALILHYHPFSSYCQKVLVALYEREVPFEGNVVDLGDPEQKAALERLWPMGKFPVLRDDERGATVSESTLIIEYLDRIGPAPPLVPPDPDAAREVHLVDRVLDHYVETPMQKAVADNFRPEGHRDPYGVDEAKTLIGKTYRLLDNFLSDGRQWLTGDDFSLADCGAGPALFYANIVEPFVAVGNLEAYYERLLDRPSFARAVEEARPYRHFFPLPWPENYT